MQSFYERISTLIERSSAHPAPPPPPPPPLLPPPSYSPPPQAEKEADTLDDTAHAAADTPTPMVDPPTYMVYLF